MQKGESNEKPFEVAEIDTVPPVTFAMEGRTRKIGYPPKNKRIELTLERELDCENKSTLP